MHTQNHQTSQYTHLKCVCVVYSCHRLYITSCWTSHLESLILTISIGLYCSAEYLVYLDSVYCFFDVVLFRWIYWDWLLIWLETQAESLLESGVLSLDTCRYSVLLYVILTASSRRWFNSTASSLTAINTAISNKVGESCAFRWFTCNVLCNRIHTAIFDCVLVVCYFVVWFFCLSYSFSITVGAVIFFSLSFGAFFSLYRIFNEIMCRVHYSTANNRMDRPNPKVFMWLKSKRFVASSILIHTMLTTFTIEKLLFIFIWLVRVLNQSDAVGQCFFSCYCIVKYCKTIAVGKSNRQQEQIIQM